MSGGQKPLPPLIIPDGTKNAPSKGAVHQLNILVEYIAKEFLDVTPKMYKDLLERFGVPAYPERIREVYDCIIDSINRTSNAKRARWELDKMGNIFNDFAGITPENRSYQAPIGVEVFEATGKFEKDNDGSTRCQNIPN